MLLLCLQLGLSWTKSGVTYRIPTGISVHNSVICIAQPPRHPLHRSLRRRRRRRCQRPPVKAARYFATVSRRLGQKVIGPGISRVMGLTPKWIVSFHGKSMNILLQWMRTWGTPISGNLHRCGFSTVITMGIRLNSHYPIKHDDVF